MEKQSRAGSQPLGGGDDPGVAWTGRAHERLGVDLRLLAAIAGVMVVTAAVIHLALWWLLKDLAAREGRGWRATVSLRTRLPVPSWREGEPAGQVDGIAQMKALRASEDARLNRYGWIDPKAGVVRIPIERAMELVAQEGRRP